MKNVIGRGPSALRRLALTAWLVALSVALLVCPAAAADRPTTEAWLSASTLSADEQHEALSLVAQRPLDLAGVEQLVAFYARVDQRIAESNSLATPEQAPEGGSLPLGVWSDVALRRAGEHFIHRRYEECLAWLKVVDAQQCSSAELTHYYAAVAHHQLVQMEEAAAEADRLLALENRRLRRGPEVARIIKRDAEAHEPDSLTRIAQQMGDVRRRLWLGRSDDANLALQQEVIDALDKTIDKLEEQRKQQQQQQQQQQLAQGGGSRSSQPMQESRGIDQKGAGEVDERDIPPGGDWGSLPPPSGNG